MPTTWRRWIWAPRARVRSQAYSSACSAPTLRSVGTRMCFGIIRAPRCFLITSSQIGPSRNGGIARHESSCVVGRAHAALLAHTGRYAPLRVGERARERAGVIEVADAGVELLWGMRLTRKFIAALVIGVAIVALIQGYLDYQRERDVFDRQMRSEAAALGRALARGVADVWYRDGEAAARDFLNTATNQSERVQARWVWP